jgi:pimeloyl-ACP methyl ester carboxylesterase
MKRGNLFFKQFIACAVIFCSLFTGFGQTRRTTPKPAATKPVADKRQIQRCAGGWSGVVTYKKILKDSLESDEPGIRKSIDRIKHKTSRDYNYTARAIVDGTDPQNPSAATKIDFTDKDLSWGEERVFDTCNSRENGHWFIIEGTDNRLTAAQASGSARSFNLSVDQMSGTYGFSLQFPNAQGTFNREEHVRRSGHCQEKNNLPFDRSTNEPTKIDGESFSVYGEKIDPNNPDTISGTKTWGDDGRGAVRSFVYQVTWRFTRCPQKLLITDLKFEQMRFPNWDDWQEVVEQTGTIDGNWIRIKAKVLNLSAETKFAEVSFKETYKGDKWDGARPDLPLKDSSVSVRLEAGEEREVEILWDSQGYAWFDDGRPRLLQRIKAEVWEDFKLKDQMTKNLKISPKPLIFVPGIWTDMKTFDPLYQNLLTASHSYGWKAQVFGGTLSSGKINTEPGTGINPNQTIGGGKSVYDNADDLTKYLDSVRRETNAWHVDLLAHSTGGLIARLYVHKAMEILPDNYPVVKHLMMLGVPNKGVPCADSMKNNDAFKNFMKTAQELMPDEMAIFNQYVKERKGTRFSALVGNSNPLLCATLEWNDGFVSVESAKFGVEDYALTKDSHPDLINAKNFGDFIKPHVVTGPRGTYPLPVKSEEGGKDTRNAGGN